MTASRIHAPKAQDHEPDDPRNALLDLVEGNVAMLVGLGLEAPLLARLRRLLPGLSAPAPDAEGRHLKAPEKTPSRDIARDLDLASILAVCRQLERFKLAAAQHAAIAHLKVWLVEEIGRGSSLGASSADKQPRRSSGEVSDG